MANVSRINQPGGAMGNMADKAEGVMDAVKDKTNDLVANAGQFAEQAKDKAQEYGAKAQEYGAKAYEAVKDQAQELAHKAEDVGQELTGMIRKYPLQSLLIGIGVGFLVGAAIRGR